MTDPPRTLKELFLAVLEVAPADRAAWLERECSGDGGLRHQLNLMLEAHDAPHSLLDPPAMADPGVTINQPPLEKPGTQIGPYKLLQEIGQGGMGVVYMAEQQEPVRRKVALKIIKPGMDTRQVIARFEAERQALSLMDHPNIAKVLDAGTTDSGRPYFVMELVKGQPITGYCDKHRLTPRQRLEMLIPVCQAIQHAHQKGIIHRDIKPSNILVAEYDQQAVPKVIDFGVAKAISQPLSDKTMFTGFGQIVGTLEYMSPEQARVNQIDIDTRSDIYSLGVLTYELLTGSTPFDKQRLHSAAWDEMLRIIREEEPPKPSTRLSDSDDALPSISALRATEPAKLTKLVRGELDWIVMKALEKDRNRRYETANGFALDVLRYLADEPVQACPPSVGYRFRKFVRRNKGPVSAAALIVLALLGGVIGTTLQAMRARRERDDKQAALSAETEARRQARQALDEMTSHIIDDWLGKQTELLPEHREYLRRALSSYEEFSSHTGDDEESRLGVARAYHRVGQIRKRLGLKAEAGAALGKALELYEALVADFPATVDHRREFAGCEFPLGVLQTEWGSPAQAEQHYKRCIGLRRALLAENPRAARDRDNLANCLNSLGLLQDQIDRASDAETSYREAIRIQEALVSEFPDEAAYVEHLAASRTNFGVLLRKLGRSLEAQREHQRSLELNHQLNENFPGVAEYRDSLASNYLSLGNLLRSDRQYANADAAYLEAKNLYAQLVADFPGVPAYRRYLAVTHSNRAFVLISLNRPADAEDACRSAIELNLRLVDNFPDAPAFAVSLGGSYCSLGQLLNTQGKLEESLTWYAKGISVLSEVVKREPELATAREFLRTAHGAHADNLARLERHAEAITDYDHALRLGAGKERDFLRLRRAISHAGLGEHAAAVTATEAVIAESNLDGELLYNAAFVYTSAMKVVLADAALREAYGARAVALLRQAAGKGYTDLPTTRNLTMLHDRTDFQELLNTLQSMQE